MDLIVYAIPAFILLIAIELIIQHIRKSPLYRFNDMVTNINCGVTQQVTGVLSKSLLVVTYLWIYDQWRLFTIPDTWYTWLILFIGVDFFYYLAHRYAHEIALLWGSHAVHHQSEEYNLSVALRQSAIQTFVTSWFYLPLAFLGFSFTSFLFMASVQTLYQFWIHTKLIKKMPAWFEFVFNTPSHHRVHHGSDPRYIDKNHGGTLIIFDRIFGTFVEEDEEAHYGVTKPVNSWNVVWANIEYYKWLGQVFTQARGFDKFRVLFKKTGWRPDYLGGPLHPQDTPAGYTKYNADTSLLMHIYIMIQFIALLAGTSVFLFNVTQYDTIEKITYILLILWLVINIGGIFEQKRWIVVSETLRIIITLFLILTMNPLIHMWIKTVVLLSFTGFFMIYLTFRYIDSKRKSPNFV